MKFLSGYCAAKSRHKQGWSTALTTDAVTQNAINGGTRALVSAVTRLSIQGGKLNWEAVAADTIYGMQNSFKQTDTKIMGTTGADGQQASSDQSQERLANAQEEQSFKLGDGAAQVNQGNTSIYGRGIQLADAGTTMSDVGLSPTQEAMRRLASNPSDPLGRADGIYQGNDVWSYPVNDKQIESRELPPTGLAALGTAVENKLMGAWTAGEKLLGDIAGTIENGLASALLPTPSGGGQAPTPNPGAEERLAERGSAVASGLKNVATHPIDTLNSLFVQPAVDSYQAFQRGDQVTGYSHAIDEVLSVGSVVVPALRAEAGAEGAAARAIDSTGLNKTSLAYDISNWGEFGLPSDGVFSRTVTAEQYRAYRAGREFNFAGKPWAEGGYPNGMGFVGAAEDARGLTSATAYREGLKLDYNPNYVLEFQLRDPIGLQNALRAPYQEFVPGGKTGAGLREWNVPGISSNDIMNSTVRVLK